MFVSDGEVSSIGLKNLLMNSILFLFANFKFAVFYDEAVFGCWSPGMY
jgi:hypothetical protein